MSLERSIADKVPPTVKLSLLKASPEQQQVFVSEYKRKSWNGFLYFILAIFGIHLLIMGRYALFALFFVTWGGLVIWYIVELFYVWKRVGNRNESVAAEIMRDIKIMDSAHHNITINNAR